MPSQEITSGIPAKRNKFCYKTQQTTTHWYHNGFIPPPVNDCLLILHNGKDHYNWVMKNDETLLSTDKRHADSSTQLSIDKETRRNPFSIENTELKKTKAVQKQIDGTNKQLKKGLMKNNQFYHFLQLLASLPRSQI